MPSASTALEHRIRTLQCDHNRNERELSDLHAEIEKQQRQRNLIAWQAECGQTAGETESVQQPERERNHPRVPDREARLSAPDAHDPGPRNRIDNAIAAFNGAAGT